MKISVTHDEVRAPIITAAAADDKLKRLSNLNSNSVWMKIVNAIAFVVTYLVNQVFKEIFDSIWSATAGRYALARHLGEEGLSFKEPSFATTTIRIGASAAPTGRKDIPQGAIVKTPGETGFNFELLDAAFIDESTPEDDEGYFTVPVLVRAIATGPEYNVQASTITVVDTEIDGVDVCYNPNAATGGADEETLEAARLRLKDKREGIAIGTMAWFKSEAETLAGVQQCIVVPRYNGRGTVGLLIVGIGGPASSEVLTAVEEHFNQDALDPAGAFHVTAALPTPYVQNIVGEVWYDPELGAPTDEALDAAINAYLTRLPTGGDIIKSVMESNLIALGLKDAKLTTPANNVTIPSDQVAVMGTTTWTKTEYTDG